MFSEQSLRYVQEQSFHIILRFYIISGTKYKLYLSATVKMIPIKASGSIPAVLVPQIAQSIT